MSMVSALFIPKTPKRQIVLAATLLSLEMLVIGLIFKHGIDFTCLDSWPKQACSSASTILVSIYCMIAALALFAMMFPRALTDLTLMAGERTWPLVVNVAGTALTLTPVLFLVKDAGTATVLPAFLIWALGTVLLLGGLALYIAPADRWRQFLLSHALVLVPMLLASAAAPFLAKLIRPIWRVDTISDMTFHGVATLVRAVGYEVETTVGRKVIGNDSFAINVAPACSGVEGFALVTIFVTIYLLLFKRELRFPHALLLYPVGLLVSAAFNVLRITLLLIIGLEGNPALAVGGFHSHAGWLMFTLVALGIIALAQTVTWLRKDADVRSGGAAKMTSAAQPLPLREDPMVAQILPFAIFMFSALLAQVMVQSPGVVYPLRVIVTGAVLALFLRLYLGLNWRLDPISVAAGAAIGLMWCLIPVDAGDGAPPYGTLSGGLLVAWFVMRGIGTTLLVPLVEELFFRGYLEKRLCWGSGRAWRWFAVCVTAALFAALHDRWIEAFFASLVFSWVMRRKNNVTDAIVAHAVANAIVFAVAASTGQIHII